MKMQPFASSRFYPNYEENVPKDRLIAAFGRDKSHRLSLVKSRYDPMNVFRLNRSIPSAASS